MAYFHTTVLDNQIKALPTVGTASGSVASFDTNMTEDLISCVSYINATQASGTPTPTDPKAITGKSSITLTHILTDPPDLHLYTINFGQTVYGGYIDVITGKLNITHEILTLDGTENITLVGSGTNRRFNLGQYPQYSSILYSSHFIESISNVNPWGYYRLATGYLLLMDNNEQMTDVTALQTWLETQYNNDTPVQFLCELETPITLDVSSVSIPTYNGENQISGNTNGNTEVKFLLTVGKAIS